jgi:osmotically-inducible protein OsmY
MFKPIVAVAALLAVMLSAAPGAQQPSDTALVAAVKRALADQGDMRRLGVTASGSDIKLIGRLPTLWLKQAALRRAMKVPGVGTVTADIELPRLQSDVNLAYAIGNTLDGYPYYTLFDYVDAVIRQGTVKLTGSVTAQNRDKAKEIGQEIAKVRGVQEIDNQIMTLPESQADDNIRSELYDRLLGANDLDQLITRKIPPIRIVVDRGSVTLYGFVPGEVEYRQLESIARFTPGVLRVQNNVRTTAKAKR